MKRAEEFQSILSFIDWLSSSDSGVGLCHLNDGKRTPLSDKDKIEIVKQFLNSPERS